MNTVAFMWCDVTKIDSVKLVDKHLSGSFSHFYRKILSSVNFFATHEHMKNRSYHDNLLLLWQFMAYCGWAQSLHKDMRRRYREVKTVQIRLVKYEREGRRREQYSTW